MLCPPSLPLPLRKEELISLASTRFWIKKAKSSSKVREEGDFFKVKQLPNEGKNQLELFFFLRNGVNPPEEGDFIFYDRRKLSVR